MPTSTATAARDSGREVGIRIKICGVTRTDDALLAIDLGAALIGLNFYPPSPRYVTPERAGELVRAVRRQRLEHGGEFESAPDRVRWVGVFVDETAEHVARIAEVVGLDLVQLHGDEDPDEMAELGHRNPSLLPKVIKVFRVRPDAHGEGTREEMERRMDPWRALGVWGFLVDTHHPNLYGGTGESWDFASLARLARGRDVRLLLAGGLTPENVGAVLEAGPWGIDLCSGVESEPGRKDSHLMRRLFEEIHHGTSRSAT